MSLSLKTIRANCQKARDLMHRARQTKFAVGAFNIDNQETLIAIAKAAHKFQAPVMVEVSQGEVNALGLENIRDMVDNYKEQYQLEMYINLDHSPTVGAAKAAIDCGYEFIHIDISQAHKDDPQGVSGAEIVAATKAVVDYAKLISGAIVESEPHYFGGSSNVHKQAFDYQQIKKTFSTPAGAKKFVKTTGVDTFAAAIGNLHGSYPVPKLLDLKLLTRIRESLAEDVNISLHGGSGTPAHFFEDAIKIGVTKININSDMRKAFRQTLERVLAENPDQFAVMKLMEEVKVAVQAVVEDKLQSYNAAGKANY